MLNRAVSFVRAHAPGSATKDSLFGFLQLLLSARNAVNSGATALQSSATDLLQTSVFFTTHACRQLFFNIFGLLLFLTSFFYDIGVKRHEAVGIKKIIAEHAEGKGLRLFIGFAAGTAGAAMLYSQEDPAQRNNIVLTLSWIFLSFCGYATSEGDFTNTVNAILKKIKSNPTPEAIEQAQFQLGGETKGVLENLMLLVVSYRNSVQSSGGSSIVGNDSATLSADRLQTSYALIEAIFGGTVTTLFLSSLLYDLCSGRAKKLGFAKTWEGHFSGKRADLFVAGILSFAGSILMLTFPANPVTPADNTALAFASAFLYFSGFLTGPKTLSQIWIPAAAQPAAAASHEPSEAESNNMGRLMVSLEVPEPTFTPSSRRSRQALMPPPTQSIQSMRLQSEETQNSPMRSPQLLVNQQSMLRAV